MADVTAPLAHGLAPIGMHPPRVPTFSTVTNRLVSSPEAMRSNLIAQMTSPVRYVDLIADLAARGIGAIVEVGPQQILTGLNQKILSKLNVASIASDDKTRGGVARLLAVQACLEVRGILDQPPKSPAIDVFAEMPAPVREAETRSAAVSDAAAPAIGRNGASPAPTTETVLVFSGTPYEIGRAHGQALAAEIRSVARRYADMAGVDWDAGRSTDFAEFESFSIDRLAPEEQEELRGVADGAGVSAEMLAMYNAWSDRRLTAQTAQVAAASSAGDALHAFDERPAMREPWGDLGLSQRLCVYRPAKGLAHAVVAWPGMLGASVGINQQGLAVSSVGLATDSESEGPSGLRTALVRRVLAHASDIDTAAEILNGAADFVAGEFCLSHPASNTIRFAFVSTQGAPGSLRSPARLLPSVRPFMAVLVAAANALRQSRLNRPCRWLKIAFRDGVFLPNSKPSATDMVSEARSSRTTTNAWELWSRRTWGS